MEKPRQVEGLELQPADDGYIVYQPEQDQVHYLNATAVLILQLCDGTRSVADVAALAQQAYAESNVLSPGSVADMVDKLAKADLIR